jgi:DNA-binding Lrp family transcriptional regulator
MYNNDKISQEEFLNNSAVRYVMDENNPVMLDILNHLLYLSTIHRRVFPSQITLAKKFGVSRVWVNTLLRRWKEAGVIKYRQRGLNESCIYFINPTLKEHRLRIKHKLPAAMFLLAVSSLCSAVWAGDLTLTNIRNYYASGITITARKLVTPAHTFNGKYSPRETETVYFLKKNNKTAPVDPTPHAEWVTGRQTDTEVSIKNMPTTEILPTASKGECNGTTISSAASDIRRLPYFESSIRDVIELF